MKCNPIFSEDDADLRSASWILNKDGYARISKPNGRFADSVMAHHVICERQFGRKPNWSIREVCDHIDGNKLNNSRDNVRITSIRENSINSKQVKNASNMTFLKKSKLWQVQFRRRYIGAYKSKETAISVVETLKREAA